MDLKFQYKSLVESLRLLGSSYSSQVDYLPDFVDVQDEIVAIFSDSFLLLPQLIEGNLLSSKAIASIIRCFNWMHMNMRNESFSNLDSFKSDDAWTKVRHLANKALEDMQEQKGAPDLRHIDWIN